VAANAAYVVGFTSGRLWKINLTTARRQRSFRKGKICPVDIDAPRVCTELYVSDANAEKIVGL